MILNLNILPISSQFVFLKDYSDEIVKFLRQQKSGKEFIGTEYLKCVTKAILDILYSKNTSYLTSEIIVLINNAFNLNSRFIEMILENKIAVRNLRKFCMSYLKEYQ